MVKVYICAVCNREMIPEEQPIPIGDRIVCIECFVKKDFDDHLREWGYKVKAK